MYTLYDIEISKEILSSLSFIALESGITFSNKLQFNNIIYKLYNYLKDDFVFENGITINEEIKSKINEFKNICNDLPNPNIEDGEKLLFTIPAASSAESTTLFADWEKLSIDALAIYEYPHKFIPSGTGSSLSCRISLFRATDGYERYITPSAFSIPANTSYFKIRIGRQSTRYVLYVDFYTIDDALISTTTANGSTSYGPATYTTFKINYIYHSTQTIDVYDFVANDFSIDESNIANIDTSKLIENDLYYSSDISFGKDDESITINHLLKKTLNGETFGFKYGTIKTYLGLTCNYDKNIFKFLTITANEEQTTFTGYVSTYPLYATNTSGNLGLWFLNTSDPIPVKVFKSENGESWSEITSNISSSLPYNGDSITVQTTALSYVGEDIIYSNYPVYYSLVGTNFEVSLLDENQEVLVNDEGIPYALEEDNTFKLYRNSDEDFTLDMLPLGASFYFGKHKIEDSPRFKLIFRPMDYTNNINTAYGDENWLPKDSVYCDSVHIIDKLTFHNNKNYNNENIMYHNSHLPRWLNSDAPEGEWWTQINEYDSPSTEENMYNNASSKGYSYGHRAGFLYNFAEEEKALLQPFTGWTVYNGLKVLLMDSTEGPATSAKTYRPKLFKACGSSTVGVLRPYYVNELKYHKNSSVATACATPKNDFVSTYTYSYFWCRNKGTNNGQYADFTSNGTMAYYGDAVKPVVCLDKNVKIKREPDEYGIFSLDLPIPETTDVILDFDIERKITNNKELQFDTQLKILENYNNNFETKREIGVSNITNFDIERIIQENCSVKYPLIRDISSPIEKKYPTVREVNYFYNFRFPTELRTIRNVELQYPTIRDVIEEFFINEKFETNRLVTETIIKRFNVERNVLGVVNKDYQLLRYVQENIEPLFEAIREVIVHREFDCPLQRNIENDIDINYPTRLKTTNNISVSYDTQRKIYQQEIFRFNTKRIVRKNVEKEFLTGRFVQAKYENTYELLRFICEPTILRFETKRTILNKSSNLYPLVRRIKKEEVVALTFDIIRDILNNTDFLANTIRYVQENYSNDIETCRSVVEDIIIINENFKREVLENMNENYPTKRFITNDTDKYVSKANLILYTQLLKEQIAEYIDLKIAEEFSKRNL